MSSSLFLNVLTFLANLGFERLGGFAMASKEKYAADTVPIAYFASIADIGLTVVYLVSSAGRYITGIAPLYLGWFDLNA